MMLGLGVVYHFGAPFLPAFWQFSRGFLPDAAPYFALGLASAVWMRSRNPMPFLVCLAIICGLALLSGVPGKALIGCGWTVMLLAQRNPRMPLLPKLLDSRVAQYLGAISYPLYLVNQPIQRGCAMLIAPLFHGNAMAFSWFWLPAALAAPVFAAMALHHWVEAPMMRLGKPGSRKLPVLAGPGGGFLRADRALSHDGRERLRVLDGG
jgi:peptidoglycan/LPS O-acetylase OafA/YrhL